MASNTTIPSGSFSLGGQSSRTFGTSSPQSSPFPRPSSTPVNPGGTNPASSATAPTVDQLSNSLAGVDLQSPPNVAMSQISVNSSENDTQRRPINNGTGAPYDPFVERDPGAGIEAKISMETITFSPEFVDFSAEELRVVDYAQGRKAVSTKFYNTLDRMKGPSIEIIVGSKAGEYNNQETWCLPKRLISHHSLFLKAASSLEFKEKEENRILLAEEDPRVFALFVEWMYYGDYSTLNGIFNADEKAWILGDKLMSTDFKNHAMTRVYKTHHIDNEFCASVSTDMVSTVCEHTVEGAKLRQFYIDFIVTHFSDTNAVVGTTEEWDGLMLDFDELRLAVYEAMRSSDDGDRVGELEDYLETTMPSKGKQSGRSGA